FETMRGEHFLFPLWMCWMTKVELSAQVVGFVRRQAPEPRLFLRAGLRRLESEQGDIKSLEGPLSGYYRFRVRGYRVIFAFEYTSARQRVVKCIFIERRNIVYEVFEALLKKKLLQ
ncbi:MAG: type II toxin-antitoxin system RelE/ParE family toxin, partial [Kiritimatiellia bacterium]